MVKLDDSINDICKVQIGHILAVSVRQSKIFDSNESVSRKMPGATSIFQTETTNQQIKEVQKKTHTEEFEFPGSRSEQGYDSVATVHLAHEYEIVR